MWLGLAAVACAGQAAPRDAAPPLQLPPPTSVVPTPTAPPLRTPGALRASTWMFYAPIGPLGCGVFGGGLSADCDPHFVGDPRVYHARGGHLVRDDAGTVVFDVPIGELPADQEQVVSLHIELAEVRIAAVVDGDVVVSRRSANDGALIAVYRVAHQGSPATRVQLDGASDTIIVRALADRPWSAMLDAHDGSLIDRAEAGVSLSELAPDAPGRSWERARASAATGDVTARRGHVRSRGEHTWDVALDELYRCGAYAIASVGSELAVLHHCPATSSAELTFIDRASGAAAANVLGGTIGIVGHSMYRSEVDLAVAGGLLYVRGDESGGTYVCVIDPREHRALACSIQRS